MRFTSLKLNSVRDLLVVELRDLYSVENQLVEALPKMAEAANASQLKSAFETYLNQTREHVNRLDRVFQQLGEKPQGETCEAMKGLIVEGQHFVKAQGDKAVIDAGLIGATQRICHYQMAGYGTGRTLARLVGENQIAQILQQTLDEEGEADKKLTEITESRVNQQAASR
jgi:ferritin-like metal-binding protein YciE